MDENTTPLGVTKTNRKQRRYRRGGKYISCSWIFIWLFLRASSHKQRQYMDPRAGECASSSRIYLFFHMGCSWANQRVWEYASYSWLLLNTNTTHEEEAIWDLAFYSWVILSINTNCS